MDYLSVMIELIKVWDEEFFLWMNSFHAPWLDPVMFQLTKTLTWIPLYAFLLFKIYRHDSKNVLWVIGGVVITILLSDQITSGIMKPYFERLRPCHDPRWEGLVHLYGSCGGKYGFVSSHAANTFGLATFLTLRMRGLRPIMLWIYAYAFLVSYSRIYLGVHYPMDIFGGTVIGVLAGFFSWFIVGKVQNKVGISPG